MDSEQSNPITTYTDRIRFVMNRTFELFPDRLRILGSLGAAKADCIIPLNNIALPPSRLWVRSRHYTWAMRLIALGAGGAIGSLIWEPPLMMLPTFIMLELSAAFVYLAYVFQRNEWWQYKNTDGIVLFDICRVGPQADSFEDFNAQLASAIENASRDSQTAAS